MDWKKPVGDKLHQLRRDRRETLREVAAQVHVNYTDLSKLERGQRPGITFDAMVKLASYYGVRLDELFLIKKNEGIALHAV